MWDLLETIGGLFEFAELLAGWRFYLCLLAAALTIAVIYIKVESEALSLAISAPLAVGMLIAGVVWEFRAG